MSNRISKAEVARLAELAEVTAERDEAKQVAAFRERAAGVLRSILIEHHLSDTAQASIIGDFRDDVRLPVDDSSLREHDAALLKRFEDLAETLRSECGSAASEAHDVKRECARRLAAAIKQAKG